MHEIIVASRVEQTVSKSEILEIYLNSIYLGRAAWGIEMAAQSYFSKTAKQLTLAEGAFLAGITKGPNYYNPDRHRARTHERLAYVLARMQEDGVIDAEQMKEAQAQRLELAGYARPRRYTGFHLVDQINREAKAAAGIDSLTAQSYSVRSTVNPQLQWAAEAALQEGLARYEQTSGWVQYQGPEAKLADAIKHLDADPKTDKTKPTWLQALENLRLPLYDVHWLPAVVVEKTGSKNGFDSIRVGLRDGRIFPLSTFGGANVRRTIALHDVVYVNLIEGKETKVKDAKGKETTRVDGTRVDLRARPQVQAATVVLENSTGRILAMVGGYGGATTLRRALENLKNLVTAHLLEGAIAGSPEDSLDKICNLAKEAHLYANCERYYPFVLGAQAVRIVDLATFYAAVANEGGRPTPHLIDSIERDGQTVYRAPSRLTALASADAPTMYQLKRMLQGVLARGTARAVSWRQDRHQRRGERRLVRRLQ